MVNGMSKKKILKILLISAISFIIFVFILIFSVKQMMRIHRENKMEDYILLAEESFDMLDNGQMEMFERYLDWELSNICSNEEVCDVIDSRRVLCVVFYEEDVVFIIIDQPASFRGDSGYAIVRNGAVPQTEYSGNNYEGPIHYEQINDRIYSFSVGKM